MADQTDVLMVFCTAPTEADAERLAAMLVNEKLAACVNLLPHIRSIYRWEGQVQDDKETLMLIKTSHARYADLAAAIDQAHPYTVPEVLAVPVARGLPAYLAWVQASCGDQQTDTV